jgi:hypothetical protein
MRRLSAIFIVVALAVPAFGGPARAADVICYNCPPQWADFASMLKAVKADLGYEFRPGAVTDYCGKEQPGRRYRLLRRQLRHEGKSRGGHRRV